ncbi:hypothetical protein KSP40_PGU020127 [Platanthera guangdongensis]|uniref:Uncharacterized protein n=1 Tax=Platanthera guangdongensis TaxID=2320717 RepID=A0ABR2N068_9ASPA
MAEASSRLQVLPSPNENQGYWYGDVSETSPCSVKSWSNSDVLSTPSSYTKSRSNGVISPFRVNSSTLDLEARRLPTRTVLEKHQTDMSPLNSSSFRFGCKPAFLNFIDLNCFKNFRFSELLKAEKKKKDKSSVSDVGNHGEKDFLVESLRLLIWIHIKISSLMMSVVTIREMGMNLHAKMGAQSLKKEMGLDPTSFRPRITKSVIKCVNQNFLLCIPIQLLIQLARMVFSSLPVTLTGLSF